MNRIWIIIITIMLAPTLLLFQGDNVTVGSAYDVEEMTYQEYLYSKGAIDYELGYTEIYVREQDWDDESGYDFKVPVDWYDYVWNYADTYGPAPMIFPNAVEIKVGVMDSSYTYIQSIGYSYSSENGFEWDTGIGNNDFGWYTTASPYDVLSAINTYDQETYRFEEHSRDDDYVYIDFYCDEYPNNWNTDLKMTLLFPEYIMQNEVDVVFYSNLFFGTRDSTPETFITAKNTSKSFMPSFDLDNTIVTDTTPGTGFSMTVYELGESIFTDGIIGSLPVINSGDWSFGIVETGIDYVLEGGNYLLDKVGDLTSLITDAISDIVNEIFNWWPWG